MVLSNFACVHACMQHSLFASFSHLACSLRLAISNVGPCCQNLHLKPRQIPLEQAVAGVLF